MAAPPAQMTFRQVLEMRPVRRLWLGQLVSIFGDFLALFAVISIVSFKLHGTAAQVTLISISFMLPLALLGPIAGVFVDRWDVKRTMIASDLIRAGLALLLVFVRDLYGIYAILFAMSTVSSFFIPAQSVTIRTLVPPAGLLATNALMQQAMQLTRIVSPPIAGALVASLGAESCFYFDTISFFFSALMLSAILINRSAAPAAAEVSKAGKIQSILRDLSAGMRFIFTHAAISFVIVSMAAGIFVMGCFGPLIAIYVRDYLSGGSFLFGIVSGMLGVGMIVGTQLLTRFARTRSKQGLVLGGLLMIGVAVALMALVTIAWFTGVGMFVMGFGVAFIITPSQTLLQQETPVAMVGRVSSSVMSVLTLSQVLGLVMSGSLAGAIGIRNLFFACAAVLIGIAVFGYLRLPSELPDKAAATSA